MQVLESIEITSTRANPHIDPAMHIWGWEVPIYLFLGGLVAGLLLLNAFAVLANREQELPTTSRVLPLLWIPLLGLGLGALFLDLEYKQHVYRFYTAFRWTSPMSWGSWILLVVFGSAGLSTLAAWARSSLPFARLLREGPLFGGLVRFAERNARPLARTNAILGASLGIYTGILLSNFASRPLWNSGLLGPLFLVSGLSTGAALGAMLSRDHAERERLVRFDVLLIVVEAALLGLWMISLRTGGEASREALGLLLGGPYGAVFWSFVVIVGLATPLLLEVMALKGRWRETLVAPALVLVGGLSLRFVLVYAGQHIGY